MWIQTRYIVWFDYLDRLANSRKRGKLQNFPQIYPYCPVRYIFDACPLPTGVVDNVVKISEIAVVSCR